MGEKPVPKMEYTILTQIFEYLMLILADYGHSIRLK